MLALKAAGVRALRSSSGVVAAALRSSTAGSRFVGSAASAPFSTTRYRTPHDTPMSDMEIIRVSERVVTPGYEETVKEVMEKVGFLRPVAGAACWSRWRSIPAALPPLTTYLSLFLSSSLFLPLSLPLSPSLHLPSFLSLPPSLPPSFFLSLCGSLFLSLSLASPPRRPESTTRRSKGRAPGTAPRWTGRDRDDGRC